MTDNIFNVNSSYQKGGITAGQINIGNFQRVLTTKTKSQITLKLPSDIKIPIEIIAVGGDREAQKFALKIWNFLDTEGYNLPAKVGSIMTSDTLVGININTKNKDKTIITVGNIN